MDLVLVFLLTIICFPVITLSEGVLRIILGGVFLLLFPGYTMTAALFPGKNSLTNVERVTFTIMMSFVLVTLIGLLLNYTPWGITLTPIYAATSVIIVLFSVVALIRRTRIPAAERFSLRLNFRKPGQGSKTSGIDVALTVCLVVVVIGAVSAIGYVVAHPKIQEAFSDFYVLGPDKMMENYPSQLTLGEQAKVTIGIKNHEKENTSYKVEVTIDGTEVQSFGPVLLIDGATWSNEVTLEPSKVGDNQKAEFTLYKGDDPAPYQTLHLWLTVKE